MMGSRSVGWHMLTCSGLRAHCSAVVLKSQLDDYWHLLTLPLKSHLLSIINNQSHTCACRHSCSHTSLHAYECIMHVAKTVCSLTPSHTHNYISLPVFLWLPASSLSPSLTHTTKEILSHLYPWLIWFFYARHEEGKSYYIMFEL